MKQIKRLCLWYGILTKRILKQKVFIAILLLIPMIAAGVYLMPKDDGGVLKIAIARLGDDEFSEGTISRLMSQKSVIRYTICEDEEAAVKEVESGRCDGAWIFLEDAQIQASKFAASRSTDGAVKIIEREDNAILILARESLFIAMYPYITYGAYSDFLDDLSPGQTVSESDKKHYYDVGARKSSIVDYFYVDGTKQITSGLLTAPVRGLLAMVIMLAALASCMYVCREEQRGVFERLSGTKRALLPLFCHISAIVPVAAVSLAAMYFSGLWTVWNIEILSMAMYVISAAAFCEILRILCHSEITLGAIMPVLITLMIVLCPVFLHIDRMHALQYSLPPFYYLNAILNGNFIIKFAVYDACVLAVALAMVLIKRRTTN